ncbi:MAG: YHYH protein [Devosia sp.]
MDNTANDIAHVFRPMGVLRVAAFVALKLLSSVAHAENHDEHVVTIVENGERCFFADGLPDHATGTFPNRGNPNAITPQEIAVCVTADPVKRASPTPKGGSIGIAINGVQFRPGTAGFFDPNSPSGFSRDPSSGWHLEGLNPQNILGMDDNNAHVGPNGLYHYHGVPHPLAHDARDGPIGYAADGFPIFRARGDDRSSYVLKSGIRPTGPGDAYDGTFEEDFRFVPGAGTLDMCNAGERDGAFAYFATEDYPFLPRCLWGEASPDFPQPEPAPWRDILRQAQATGGAQQRERGPRRGPPREAISACEGLDAGASCAFQGPRGERTISGTCRDTPRGDRACVPDDAPPPRN